MFKHHTEMNTTHEHVYQLYIDLGDKDKDKDKDKKVHIKSSTMILF